MLGKTAKPPFSRFETEVPSFQQAVNEAEDLLGQEGLQGVDGEPDVIIVLRHTKNRLGPDKMVMSTIYIGDIPKQDIINDLNRDV